MELVSPILDVVTRLWNGTAKRAVYIKDLKEKMGALRNAMQQLKERRDDVKGRVEREEKQPRTECTNEVKGWLDRVQETEEEVSEILRIGEEEIQKKSIFQRSFRSSYKLGKKASEMLPVVTQLWNVGHFDAVAHTLPQPPAEERPGQETVGLEAMYTEVCRCIRDDKVGIIGLYGMGGAGKTTLMTKVNNEFSAPNNDDFDVAIWVVVSRPANLGKVQQVIRNKLNIPDQTWQNRSQDERAVEIFNALKRKRFVLMLDDVWEWLDLQKVGVPSPKYYYSRNRSCSKVILTSRSLDVCRHMEAQRNIKVECLTEKDAIDLFKQKVGESTLNSHPEIPQLAEIAAGECQGLPLALVTIGRAMAGKNTPEEWERAIQILKAYPSEFSGMGDYVFPVLKFSYDNLPNDTIKACFLYLAIFPEDYEILIEDLTMFWIGEGILEEDQYWGNIEDTFNKGHDIIDHLKTACLFEIGSSYDSLKLHDVIRDMALWLATTYAGNKNKILQVEEVDHSIDQVLHLQGSKWKDAQRIHMEITTTTLKDKEPKIPPSFPNLLTLIVWGGGVGKLPSGFFQFLPIIKVMNLADTGITELPIGIGKLVTLEYLDLSGTRLKELSTELTTLKNLRCLLLNNMHDLERICKGVISNLSRMRFFSLGRGRSGRRLPLLVTREIELLEELEGLEHMNCAYLQIEGALCFQKLLSSQKLQNASRSLDIGNMRGMKLLQLPADRMKHLHYLTIRTSVGLKEIKVDDDDQHEITTTTGHAAYYNSIPKSSNFSHLRRVTIESLPRLLGLRWLVFMPSLEDLRVDDCESVEEVIGGGSDDHGVPENQNVGMIFSRLKYLCLLHLPNLRRISEWALAFPCLIELRVYHCPKLKKLPFDSNSARSGLKTIEGESKWWAELEWEDETIRLIFSQSFTPSGPFPFPDHFRRNFNITRGTAVLGSVLVPCNDWVMLNHLLY